MQIIPRNEHSLSRNHISASALKVLYRLHKAGYQAYLVGGSVRDLLLRCEPKDFDVVTDARPEEVKKLFRNCRLIGRRFRLAHIYFGWREIIEVATFRGASEDEAHRSEHGMILRDNVYGTLEDDIWRRDFTVNALYYNISDFTVVDYPGGVEDLNQKIVRMIGDPEQRFREDPIRILRAIRFAGKLEFQIEQSAEKAIQNLKELILHTPPARLFEEMQKCFLNGTASAINKLLKKYGIFELLFPQSDLTLKFEKLISQAFENADLL